MVKRFKIPGQDLSLFLLVADAVKVRETAYKNLGRNAAFNAQVAKQRTLERECDPRNDSPHPEGFDTRECTSFDENYSPCYSVLLALTSRKNAETDEVVWTRFLRSGFCESSYFVGSVGTGGGGRGTVNIDSSEIRDIDGDGMEEVLLKLSGLAPMHVSQCQRKSVDIVDLASGNIQAQFTLKQPYDHLPELRFEIRARNLVASWENVHSNGCTRGANGDAVAIPSRLLKASGLPPIPPSNDVYQLRQVPDGIGAIVSFEEIHVYNRDTDSWQVDLTKSRAKAVWCKSSN